MKFFVIFAFGVLLLGCAAVKNQNVSVSPTAGVYSIEESKAVALAFVKSDSTFLFDGLSLKEKGYEALSCNGCYAFFFEFTSRYQGYGNRSGKVITPYLTVHGARIEVRNGTVTSAVFDNKWDALTGTEFG